MATPRTKHRAHFRTVGRPPYRQLQPNRVHSCPFLGWREGEGCRPSSAPRLPQLVCSARLATATSLFFPAALSWRLKSGQGWGHVKPTGTMHGAGVRRRKSVLWPASPTLSLSSSLATRRACEDSRNIFPWEANILSKSPHGLAVPKHSHTPNTPTQLLLVKTSSPGVVPRPAASVSPGDWEMQVLTPRTCESETLGVNPHSGDP